MPSVCVKSGGHYRDNQDRCHRCGVELDEMGRECADVDCRKPAPRYVVKYYDRKLSHKGRGTQVRVFTDRAEAEAFASRNHIYARPCRVEEVES